MLERQKKMRWTNGITKYVHCKMKNDFGNAIEAIIIQYRDVDKVGGHSPRETIKKY